MNKKTEWIKAVILLPGNALVVIPFLFLYFSRYSYVSPNIFQIIIGSILLLIGIIIAIWTMNLFNTIGNGTAAPWSPPKNFVISGPYTYVRNPMLISVLIIILAMSILLNSKILLVWFTLFWFINTLYFIYCEEKDLEKRFGKNYINYKKNVPRWIPRLSKWDLEK